MLIVIYSDVKCYTEENIEMFEFSLLPSSAFSPWNFSSFLFFKAEEQLKLLPILVSTKCLEITAFEVSSFLKQKRKPGVDIKEEAILLSSNYGLSMLLHAHPIPRCFAL